MAAAPASAKPTVYGPDTAMMVILNDDTHRVRRDDLPYIVDAFVDPRKDGKTDPFDITVFWSCGTMMSFDWPHDKLADDDKWQYDCEKDQSYPAWRIVGDAAHVKAVRQSHTRRYQALLQRFPEHADVLRAAYARWLIKGYLAAGTPESELVHCYLAGKSKDPRYPYMWMFEFNDVQGITSIAATKTGHKAERDGAAKQAAKYWRMDYLMPTPAAILYRDKPVVWLK